jgi:CBS domain-containing protein/uncharacterized protein (DUF2267 family)
VAHSVLLGIGMNLESQCQGRMVVLRSDATAYDAARAMYANHVGAVLITEQGALVGIVTDRDLALRAGRRLTQAQLPIKELMTPRPVTIEASATMEEAAALMIGRRVRRLVVVRDDAPKGVVTFDDLVLTGEAAPSLLSKVVRAQLAESAPHKPEGSVRPARRRARSGPSPRSRAHRAESQQRFAARLQRLTGLPRAEALTAFEVFASNLMRRLTPTEARQFVAQLPGAVRDRLLAPGWRPDKRVSRDSIEAEVAARLELDAHRATDVVWRLGQHLGELISEGEVEDLAAQLPANLKRVLRHPA